MSHMREGFWHWPGRA